MAALPDPLRVGHLDYNVVPSYAVEGNRGECDFANRVIFVQDRLGDVEKANVLLHEILHAAWDAGDLADVNPEEKIVTILANQLTAIWRDNPDFVRFMEASFGR